MTTLFEMGLWCLHFFSWIILICWTDDEEMEGDGVIDPGIEYVPPPSGTASAGTVIASRKKVKTAEQIKQEVESEEEKTERMEGDSEDPEESNTSLQVRGRDKRKPQLEKDAKPRGPKHTSVSIYEEKLLLKRLEACPNATSMTPEARRLRRKLIVRQAKRERGLPLFDLDQVVNAALLLVDGIYGAKEGGVSRSPVGQATYRTTSQDFRILDRYQVSVSKSNWAFGTGYSRTFAADGSVTCGYLPPKVKRIMWIRFILTWGCVPPMFSQAPFFLGHAHTT